MKKPTRKVEGTPRQLKPSQLERVRGGGDPWTDGGITANDDWEAPVTLTAGNKMWTDDWLAPT